MLETPKINQKVYTKSSIRRLVIRASTYVALMRAVAIMVRRRSLFARTPQGVRPYTVSMATSSGLP